MSSSFLFLLCSCLIIFLASPNTPVEAAMQFQVGGHLGWHEPNETEFYTQWAERNRFQIGDSLVFEYQDDSVLSVEKSDYFDCDTSDPITAFDNGKSTFNLERSGAFYFISGTGDHCKNGQKLLVEVMSQHPGIKSPPPVSEAPANAPQGFSGMAPSPQSFSDSASSPSDGYESSASVMLISSTFVAPLVMFVSVLLLAH
ncbi:early nodulin-like protein 7 [Lotus japonicus]|uniref:early nodulin-like protein 7 n=1 Tax=Lotus japonicus TaxID=34305 RepID=UPI002587E514|nr:early nodulin-like protein 7 [Lotus japonicus]